MLVMCLCVGDVCVLVRVGYIQYLSVMVLVSHV